MRRARLPSFHREGRPEPSTVGEEGRAGGRDGGPSQDVPGLRGQRPGVSVRVLGGLGEPAREHRVVVLVVGAVVRRVRGRRRARHHAPTRRLRHAARDMGRGQQLWHALLLRLRASQRRDFEVLFLGIEGNSRGFTIVRELAKRMLNRSDFNI